MANANTIASLVAGTGQPFLAPLKLGTSTTETLFSNNTGVVATTLGGGVAILSAFQAQVPSFYANGQTIRIRGIGTVTTGTSTNLTLTLYNGTAAQLAVAGGVPATSFTLGSLKASSARAVNTATAPFYVDGLFQFDAVGGRLVGQVGFEINGIVDANAASTIITGMVNDQDLNFLLSATLSSGNAANVVNLQEFSIERV
jgi:hypothetical protein